MNDVPLFRYDSKQARELRSLHGITADLQAAARAFRAASDPNYRDIFKLLITAGLITYRRCFRDGARAKFGDGWESMINGASELHPYLLSQADKYAAHSVNPFENEITFVGVVDDVVTLTGTASISGTILSNEEMAMIASFIDAIVSTVVQPRTEIIHNAVLEEAQSTSIEVIKSGGPIEFTVPTSAEASRKR